MPTPVRVSPGRARVSRTTRKWCIWDRGLVEQALATAPGEFVIQGGAAERNVHLGGDHIAFVGVGGPPHITDIERGRRNGTLARISATSSRLSQHFDVIHLQSPNVEPQDIALNVRHLHVTESQLGLSDKAPFVFSRGAPQVRDCFEMIRIARGLDRA